MATPPLVVHLDSVGSTQDEARARFAGDPVLVTALTQLSGRGRSGAAWLDADRSLATSLAFRSTWPSDRRPLVTLVAGLAALDVLPGSVRLKWPNDIVVGGAKAGGILTEGDGVDVVVGMGLNLQWRRPPSGITGLYDTDPGIEVARDLAESWGRRFLERIGRGPADWGRDEYERSCVTTGAAITWDGGGAGTALGVDDDGALRVRSGDRELSLHSGSVRHVRGAGGGPSDR